jgi:hypothetical protein
MTDVNWSVPIDQNAIPASINDIIAKGPVPIDVSKILPSYWQGQDAAYKQRNQDAFQNGLPRDASGQIDWPAAYETLAKLGGTPAFGQLAGLQGYDISRQILAKPPPQISEGVPQPNMPASAPPSSSTSVPNQQQQPQQQPAQNTTDYALPPSQIARANPNGIPQAVQQPTPISDGVMQGGSITPQQLAQAQPQVNTPVNTPSPQSPLVNPDQVTQAQKYYAMSDGFRRRGDYLSQQATAAAFSGNKELGNDLRSQAEAAYKASDQYREAALKAGQPTTEALNARDQNIQSTQTQQAANKEFVESNVKSFAADYKNIVTLGRSSSQLQQQAQLAKNLTLQPGFYSGPFHEGVESYQQFRSVFGANPSAATPMEAFNKVTNDLLASQIKAMAQSGVGRVLQAEVNIMKQGIASLGITPQTNRAQLEMLNRIYSEEQRYAQIAEQVRQDPRISPQDKGTVLNQMIAQWQQQHPLFTEQEKQHPQVLGAPDAPPQSAQWTPAQKRSWASGIGLQPGDPVRMNGQIVAVP